MKSILPHSTCRQSIIRNTSKIILLFFALFLVTNSYAQKPGDSTGTGLKLLTFQVISNNYTGFNDDVNQYLYNGLKYLNDKLTTQDQGNFKAYDLGIYRLLGQPRSIIEQSVNSYLATAATSSTYFIAIVKVWKNADELDKIQIYCKLPHSLPVFSIYNDSIVNAQGNLMVDTHYASYQEAPAQLNIATKEALIEFTDFLFKLPEPEIFDPNFEEVQLITDFPARPEAKNTDPNYLTFQTITNQIFVVDVNADNFRPCHTLCEKKTRGALISFALNDQVYYSWVYRATGAFFGYAKEVPGSKGKVDIASRYQPVVGEEPDPNRVVVVFNKINSEGLERAFQYRVSNVAAEAYHGGDAPDALGTHRLSEFWSSVLELGETQTAFHSCFSRPSETVVVPNEYKSNIARYRSDQPTGMPVSGWPIDDVFDFNSNQQVRIYDYTRRFSPLLSTFYAAIPGESVDLIITDDITGDDIKHYIKDFKPIHRNFLWVQVRYGTLPNGVEKMYFDYQYIYSNALNNTIQNRLNTKLSGILIACKYDLASFFKITASVAGYLTRLVSSAKIPERFYDCTLPSGYVYADWGSDKCLVVNSDPVDVALNSVPNYFKSSTAAFSGAWNGLLDFGAGFVGLAEMGSKLAEFMLDEGEQAELKSEGREFLNFVTENPDKAIDALAALDSTARSAVSKQVAKLTATGSTLPLYYTTYCIALFKPQKIVGLFADVPQAIVKTARSATVCLNILKNSYLISDSRACLLILSKEGYLLKPVQGGGVEAFVRNASNTADEIFLGLTKEGKLDYYNNPVPQPNYATDAILNSTPLEERIATGDPLSLYEMKKPDGTTYPLVAPRALLVPKLMNKFTGLAQAKAAQIAELAGAAQLLETTIANKIVGLGANKLAFLEDLIASNGLEGKLSQLTTGMIDTWAEVKGISKLARSFDWLKRCSAWKAEGYTLEENIVEGTLKIKDGTPVAIIKDEILLIVKYDVRLYTPNYANVTPVGEVVNGCQAYKIGNQRFFKRIPDFGDLEPYYKEFFEGSSDLHGAEKHFPDVPKEAIKYRATTGPPNNIAPDGSTNNATASTKWKSYDAIREAIDISKVELDKKLAGGYVQDTWTHPYSGGRSSGVWGVGYKSGIGTNPALTDYNGGFKMIWKKMPNGKWKISTFYPQ